MNTPRWTLRALAVCAALVGGATSLAAQGVTTGAVSGVITTEQGSPLAGAQVSVINAATGARSAATTRPDGRYYVSSLEVGGPYTVSVRHIGFAQHDTTGLNIALGQNLRVDITMHTQAAVLSAVTATASAPDAIISASRTGSMTVLTDSAITRLPTLNRNFTDFVSLTPQVSTKGPGTSGGGQNNRFNAIQIDGSVGNDLFGLSSTLQPGGLANAKQVPLEAVKEYDVLLSPFDVRQGYFSGFLVNAVTKSGSNEFHGSATYAGRNEKLERNVSYLRASPFSQKQFGLWLGGPIVKDKVFFSISPEFQRQQSPQSGPYIGQPAGLAQLPAANPAAIDSLRNILINQYGFADPGNGGAVIQKNPLNNFFGRLDFVNLPHNSRLVTRYNYAGAEQSQGLTRSTSRLSLSNNGYNIVDKTNSGLMQLFSNFENGNSNELLVGYTHINDVRATPIQAPFVFISRVSPYPGNTGTGQLSAGTENSSQGNELEQGITELSDSYTIPWKQHRFTIGTKNEFYSVRNLFSQNSLGNYTFGTLDSLIANNPSSATLGEKLDNTDGAARFHARTLGFYVSDVWQTTPNLNITAGLRLDMPGLTDSPGQNATIAAALGRNTSAVPQNVKQWQPRIGFNWDVTGDQVNQLRGGTGVFMAQPAYVWLSDLFGNSGVNGYGNVSCSGMAAAPSMQNAGGVLPANCDGSPKAANITVNTVDPNLHFPEVWRSSLGFDRRLPWNVVGTLEGMYTRSVYNFYYQNTSITPTPIGTDRNGRVLYGDITSSSSNVTPVRVKDANGNNLGDVIDLTNTKTHDYSYNITAQLQKRFSNSFEGSFAYTYGRAYDIWDLTSSVAFSNWSFGRSYSSRQDAQDLAPSKWDTPHRFVASGTYSFKTHTDLSMTAFAESGTPYEYVYGNDMNGDNGTANDLIYVPKDAHDPTEIQFVQNGSQTPAQQADALESFINGHECLATQRGTIMKRNSCRTPWTKVVNLSARQSLPTIKGQNFIVQLDVFNFLNLLNKSWGAQDLGSTNSPSLLTRSTWTQPTVGQPLKLANGAQGQFRLNTVNQFSTQNASSNYALQLQLKYTF